MGMLNGLPFEIRFSNGEKSDKDREQDLQDLRDGKIRIMIVTPIYDEGVDIPNINCLFLVAGGQSLRMLLQRIGRGLRAKEDGSGVEVYDSLDLHNSYLAQHTKRRYSIYLKEEFDIIKV